MAFNSINSSKILSGEPVTNDLWTKTKDNFDDHETRISTLELSILASQYDAIVSATPISGFTTHTTISSAISAISSYGTILVLRGTYTENLTINKPCQIEGVGRGVIISGNLTFTSASVSSSLSRLKFTGILTFNSGSVGNILQNELWVPNGWSGDQNNFIDSNAVENQNFIQLMEE